jgi:hypothetical protein
VAVAGTVATLGTGVAQAIPVADSIATTSYSGGAWSPATSVPSGPGATKVAVSSNGQFILRINADLTVSFAENLPGGYTSFLPVPGLAGGSSVMQASDISDDNDSAGNLQVRRY